jgi:DNA-binding MarR family transcriptional regulator
MTVLPRLRAAYPRLAGDLLRPILDVLSKARQICGGDLEMSEILLVIAVRTVEHPAFARLSYEEIEAGAAPRYPSLTTNCRSIAASTGIPRETVRRKVASLIEAGLVERERRRLAVRVTASATIAPLREALLRCAVIHHAAVHSALEDRNRSSPKGP